MEAKQKTQKSAAQEKRDLIRIEKVTLNIGTGKEQDKLEKAVKLIKNIAGRDGVKTVSQKRIPNWGLRPGLAIGTKLTVRKAPAKELLTRLLVAKDNKLPEKSFDDSGNVAFGLQEYIDIPGVSYDPKIGVMGLQATITLEKIGYRIKKRRIMPKKIPSRHKLTKEDAIKFMQREFNIEVGDRE